MESLQKVQAWAKAHGALIGLVGFVSGTALGIGIPIWQTYWVETSRLGVEIYAIDRQVQADARIPPDDDALSVLGGLAVAQLWDEQSGGIARYITTQSARAIRQSGFTPTDITDRLNAAKSELNGIPQRLDERQRQLRDVESFAPERLTIADVNRLNAPLSSNREFKPNPGFGELTPAGQQERTRAIDHFREEYKRRADEAQKRYTELQTQLPRAEQRILELKQELEDRKGFFQITAVLNNSGRKSVSIRQLALLRVYIGRGNYVDLKLNLQKYQENAEVGQNGTRIATFNSEPLESFTDADRSLIKTYWGQSVQGRLFLEDISGSIHVSEPISFAKGLYIKEVFDRLITEAAKPKFVLSSE
jgi:hypothetical protein